MEPSSLRIQELEKELWEFEKKLIEGGEISKKLESELNQVKMMETSQSCRFNFENRIVEELQTNLKKIHEAYQKLSTQSSTQSLQYLIMNRLEELYEQKGRLESQIGHLKLKRAKEEEKLEEIKMKIKTQTNKKKALLLKLQKSCEKSEAARKEAVAKLMELKSKEKGL